MNSLKTWQIAVAFILAVAAGIGASQFQSDTKTPRRPPEQTASDGASASEPVAPSPPAKEDTATANADAAPREASLTAAIALIPTFPTDATGVITGRIVDRDGNGISGVEIVATVRGFPEGLHDKAAEDTSVEDYLRTQVQYYHYQHDARRVGKSDANGEFELTAIGGGSYAIACAHPEYVFQRLIEDWSHNAILAGSHLEFLGYRSAAIDLSLTLPDGSQPEDAMISVTASPEPANPSDPSRAARRWRNPGQIGHYGATSSWSSAGNVSQPATGETEATDKAPRVQRIQVPALPIEIIAKSSEAMSEPRSFTLNPGEVRAVTLALQQRNSISGRVYDSYGKPCDGCSIYLRPAADGPVDPDRLQAPTVESRSWRSAHYRIENVTPGRYQIAASRVYGRLEFSAMIDVNGEVEYDIHLDPPTTAGTVLVEAFGPKGEPLDQLDVSVTYHHDNSSSSSSANPISEGDGRFRVFLAKGIVDAIGNHPDQGDLELTLRTNAFGSQVVGIPVSDIGRTIRVDFETPATVEIRIVGYAENPNRHRFFVGVSRPSGDNVTESYVTRGDRQARISPDGIWRSGMLCPGDYIATLSYAMGSESWRAFLAAEQAVTLVSGENALELAIPPLYRVTIRFPKSAAGQRVRLATDTAQWNVPYATIDAEGLASFPMIPEGRYKAIRNVDIMDVAVFSDVEVSFQAAVINALSVSITDTSGALYRQGLRNDDIIVGANTIHFEDFAQLQAAMMAMMARDSMQLIVDRGGREVVVKIDTKELRNPSDMGGTISPTTH